MVDADLKIDLKTLTRWFEEKKPVTILDVRPKHEREEWLIPGSIHADVYEKLKANEKDVFANFDLPKVPIVTICAAGKTSLIAAEQLMQMGFEAYSLEGGMRAWNFVWNTAEITFEKFKVIQVRRSVKGCLSYLVGSGNEALVIDASLDPEVYQRLASDNGWTIRHVTDTHIHADYISRTRELATISGAHHIMIDKAVVEFSFSKVKDGDVISIGDTTIEVLHTPGHTWESTSFNVGNQVLFTGDTLFTDGVGRPDLKADQEEAIKKSKQLYQSLTHLLTMPPSLLVLPAHVSSAVPFDGKLITATISDLKEMPLLKLTEEEFVNYTLSRIPPTPPNFQTIASLNKHGSYEGHQPAELEAGANRCAIQ